MLTDQYPSVIDATLISGKYEMFPLKRLVSVAPKLHCM
jgi:hypothetical protein